MPTSCSALNADILINCDFKPVGGAEPLMWAINKQDWNDATITYDITNPLIIRSIALKTGAKAYQMSVFKRGFVPKWETQDSADFPASYKHSIAAKIQVYNDAVKLQIDALTNGYYVFIVENVNKTASVFEVYGADNGLRLPDAVRDLGANEGTITGTFTNDEGMNERKVPLTFLPTAGTYAATKTAVVALTVTAV